MAETEFVTRLVGVSFCEGYPESLLHLREALVAGEAAPVQLVRHLDNPVDPNAINVMCVAAGGRIGRISKSRAKYLAPALDRGEAWSGAVESILLNEEHLDKPGVIIRCHRMQQPED